MPTRLPLYPRSRRQALSRTSLVPALLASTAVLAPRAMAQDIDEIEILVGVDRTAGALDPLPYSLRISVEGTNFTQTGNSVLMPNGASLPLAPGGGGLQLSASGFSTLCELANSPTFGFGSFQFTFGGGADTVALTYDPTNPTCATDPFPGYGDVTFPAQGQVDVPLQVTMDWQCANGPCGNFAWFMELFPAAGPGAEYEADILDPSITSWTPEACLSPSTQYMFYLAAASQLAGGGPQQTTGGDDFVFFPGFEVVNQTSFTTGAAVGTVYCMSAPNSSGSEARICASGSSFVADQDLTLVASGCPDNVPGLFYFGPGQLPGAPSFGDGFRCVAVPQSRRIYPFATAGPMNGNPRGTTFRPLNFAAPYATSITVGASLNFQFWYRDNAAMMAGFNLTDAVNVVFQ